VWLFLQLYSPRFAVFFTAVAIAADSLIPTASVHFPREECLESLWTVPLFFLYLYGQGVKLELYNVIELPTLTIEVVVAMAVNIVNVGCLLIVFISDLCRDDKWNPLKWKWNIRHTWRTEDILGIRERLVWCFVLRVNHAIVAIFKLCLVVHCAHSIILSVHLLTTIKKMIIERVESGGNADTASVSSNAIHFVKQCLDDQKCNFRLLQHLLFLPMMLHLPSVTFMLLFLIFTLNKDDILSLFAIAAEKIAAAINRATEPVYRQLVDGEGILDGLFDRSFVFGKARVESHVPIKIMFVLHLVYIGFIVVTYIKVAVKDECHPLRWKIWFTLWLGIKPVVDRTKKICSNLRCKQPEKVRVVVKNDDLIGEQQREDPMQMEDFFSVFASGTNRKLLVSLMHTIFKLAVVTCLMISSVVGSVYLHNKKGEVLEIMKKGGNGSLATAIKLLQSQMTHNSRECHDLFQCNLAFQLHFLWLPLLLYSPWIAIVSGGLVSVASNLISVTPLDGTITTTFTYLKMVSGEKFIDGLLDGSYEFEFTRIDSLLPTKVLFALNILYIGCIVVTVLYNIGRNTRHSLKWKTWSKLLQEHKMQRENTLRIAKSRIDFLLACSSGENMALLRSFLHNPDFDPNQINSESGVTGLHMACHNGHLSVVQAILDVKRKVINLNIENVEGQTPLMVVAAQGSKNILNRMLKEKKLKLKDTFGQRAICVAVEAEHWAIGLSIHEEMTKRGMLFKELSILTYLSRSVTLSNDIKKGLSKDKVSLAVYKRDILKWLSETPKEDVVENLSQERVLEELKEFLECSICFDNYGDSPILSCTNDHWICSICLPRNSCCPWCREQYSTAPPQRRRTSEKILKLLAMIKM
jgi:ankyrin repeat protein